MEQLLRANIAKRVLGEVALEYGIEMKEIIIKDTEFNNGLQTIVKDFIHGGFDKKELEFKLIALCKSTR